VKGARPNFVFLMADDLGYADLGCYGGRSRCSPVLDRMAQAGLRFTQGYANSSVCSPTRFSLVTGRWPHRLRGGADEPTAHLTQGVNPHREREVFAKQRTLDRHSGRRYRRA